MEDSDFFDMVREWFASLKIQPAKPQLIVNTESNTVKVYTDFEFQVEITVPPEIIQQFVKAIWQEGIKQIEERGH